MKQERMMKKFNKNLNSAALGGLVIIVVCVVVVLCGLYLFISYFT